MKKGLLFILASLFGMTQGAWAAKTPQVIWCQDLLKSTLYFINSETVYPEGGTYNGQRITRVWGEEVLKPSSDSYQNYYPSLVPWYDYAGTGGCTKVVFDESFSEVRPTTCYRWFYKFSSLETIEGIENLNTSEVTNMAGMFQECNSSGFKSLDLSTLNTGKVKNFNFMFFNCEYLKDLNLSNFDTSNVTQMAYTFDGCERLTTLDLSSFDTKNVTDMDFMFANCTKLQTILVSRKWTVENVEDDKGVKMFNTCVDLVGGAGTKFVTCLFNDPQNCETKKYAHIDGGTSNPGYLTLKADEIALDETSRDNSGVISANNGETCNVALTRSIVPNTYNTLSLPFDVDSDVLKAAFGDDVELAQLNDTHMDDGTLYFDFVPADAITAGVPYLIYVTADVQNPLSFEGVTLKAEPQTVVTSLADFIPVFDVTTLDNGNENILFLGSNNTLYYPSTTSGDMRGFRAYFEVKGEAQGAKAMVMMDNSLTGVKTILNGNPQNEQVYDLQGRMVTRPAKGLYILNGKKVIIK